MKTSGPVLCHIQYGDVTVVVEIPSQMGDAASVARRLRGDGVAAQKRGDLVVVNGLAEIPPALLSRYA